MSCEKGCDNKYNCPPRMADGRHFTDYSPRCATNFEALPAPMSSFDYRMYLTQNAEKLMQKNSEHALKANLCAPCVSPATALAEQTVQVCDGRKCSFATNDPTGLGVGRNFGSGKGCAVPVEDLSLYPLDGKFGANFEKAVGPAPF